MGIKRRGGTAAPARPAARPAPAPHTPSPAPVAHQPTPAPTHHAAPHAPAPAAHAPPAQQPMMHQPMMQQAPQQSGGFLSNIAGGIMNGMTFGVGSAVANRAVDAVLGPRTMQVEHVNTNAAPAAAEAPAAAPAAPAMQPMMQPPQAPMASNICGTEVEYFNRCMQLNNNSLEACSTYSTALQQCQRSGH